MIIDGFTTLLRMSVKCSISNDINKFDEFTKFYKKTESICDNIYTMLFGSVNEKIDQYPIQSMSSAKFVRTYPET